MGNESVKLIANNKKAYHDYFILDTYEAGISLHGTEVKSLRMGKCSIKEAFVRIENGESYNSVATSIGIQADLLIKWHKIYRQEGIEGLQSLKRGRPKMSKMPKAQKPLDQMTPEEKVKYYEERLEYLEAENAYLKKLKALVEERQDRQRKKE